MSIKSIYGKNENAEEINFRRFKTSLHVQEKDITSDYLMLITKILISSDIQFHVKFRLCFIMVLIVNFISGLSIQQKFLNKLVLNVQERIRKTNISFPVLGKIIKVIDKKAKQESEKIIKLKLIFIDSFQILSTFSQNLTYNISDRALKRKFHDCICLHIAYC